MEKKDIDKVQVRFKVDGNPLLELEEVRSEIIKNQIGKNVYYGIDIELDLVKALYISCNDWHNHEYTMFFEFLTPQKVVKLYSEGGNWHGSEVLSPVNMIQRQHN